MTTSSLRRVLRALGPHALVDRAGTRAIELALAARLPPRTLMQRAGFEVARLALALVPHATRVVVLAGPGNNGGDGLQAAAWLHAWGRPVSVWMLNADSDLPADAADAWRHAQSAGVAIVDANGVAALIGAPRLSSRSTVGLWIDALLGIGGSRAPEGLMADAIEHLIAQRHRGARVLSIDTPSGLDVDTGQPFGDSAVVADDTLALLTLKPGLFTARGRDLAGEVWLADLQDDADPPVDAVPPSAWLVGTGDGVPLQSRHHAQHKGSFGDVAVVGGAPGMLGAAVLAARAALAAGAGRVYLNALDPSFQLDATRPELMCRGDWWQQASPALLSTSTVVCGCGGGDAVRAALPRLLSLAGRLVLDADALNAVARDAGLQALLRARQGRACSTIITPHPLEAARLLDAETPALQRDRIAAARQLAERYRCIVVLKGSGSVVAAPEEVPRINATGNASLASAGTGDVLAGWIGGRWSACGDRDDVSMIDRVAEAVAEHGRAAEPLRPGGLRAADLVERLYAISRGLAC